jgi:hypothetical protein
MVRKVLDTNVLVDIHSCHDIVRKYGERAKTLGPAAMTDRDVVFRRARAREGLLLAIYLHNVKATTFTLQGEAMRVLEKAAPPSAQGGTSLPTDHLRFFIWFVKDRVIPGWNLHFCLPKKGGNWPGLIANRELVKGNLSDPDHPDVLEPTGNRADLFHVAMAKERKLDLITNEGFTPDGYGVGKVSEWARAEGVRTLFPKDVYAGKLNEDYAADKFLERFAREAPAYLEERERKNGPSYNQDFMEYLGGYYRHILFGDVEGSDEPVPVRIGS